MITAIQKPKRKYGEGSIYQRNDGRWVAKYKSVNMLKPCVVYAKSESEAKRKLRELKKDAAKGIAECKKMLFCDYAELNCTPFVRQYDILSNRWGDLLCREENRTNGTRRNSRSWSWKP